MASKLEEFLLTWDVGGRRTKLEDEAKAKQLIQLSQSNPGAADTILKNSSQGVREFFGGDKFPGFLETFRQAEMETRKGMAKQQSEGLMTAGAGQALEPFRRSLIQDRGFSPEKANSVLRQAAPGIAQGANPLVDTARTIRDTGVPVSANTLDALSVPAGLGESDTKNAINIRLPSGDIALSYDGGRTFLAPSGKLVPVPPGSRRLSEANTEDIISATGAARKAQAQITETEQGGTQGTDEDMNLDKAARGGTGPWAKLYAAIDAVVGGVGLEKLFGFDGLFQETQENRQTLRVLRQIGKQALLNSARAPIHEQDIIDKLFPDPDKFWTNPTTEAKKLETLRGFLEREKDYNLRIIASGDATPKAVLKYQQSVRDIDDLLNKIGSGESRAMGSNRGVRMPNGEIRFYDASGKRIK